MRKRPMLMMAWVCALAVIEGLWKIKLGYFLAFAGILYYVLGFKKNKRKMYAIGLFLMLSFFFFFIHTKREVLFREKSYEGIKDGQSLILQGEIDKKTLSNDTFQYILKNCQYKGAHNWINCNNVILYYEKELEIGKIVSCYGKVKLFDRARNYGNFDVEEYYHSLKIDFSIKEVSILSLSHGRDPLKSFLFQLKEKLKNIIENNLKEEKATVLKAMLLGDKGELDQSIKILYQNSGISHILAISGLHVTFIGFYLFLFLKRFGVRVGFNCAICMAFLYCYCYMTGQGVSTQRAVGMLLITLFGRVIRRAEDLLNSLGIVIIILLWQNPFVLKNTGFLFSILAILGIGITAGVILKYVKCSYGKDLETKRSRCFMKLVQHLVMSTGIYFVTLPLVAYVYYEVPFYGILINLILLPLAPFIIGMGVMALLISYFSIDSLEWIKVLLWKGIDMLLSFIEWVCRIISKWPNAVLLVGRPSTTRIVLYIAWFIIILLVLCFFMYKRRRCWSILPFAGIILFLILWVPRKSELQVNVLDVGQGLGVHIQTEVGENFFFDGGSSDVKHVGERRMIPFLKAKGISRIDYWFISHLDEDHFNGFLEVISDGYPVNAVILPKYIEKDEIYERVVGLLLEYNIPCFYMKASDEVTLKSGKISCIWPDKHTSNKNDGSLVLQFETANKFRVLLPGDISAMAEREIVSNNIPLSSGVLIAAHHGSNNSSSEDFLRKTGARIVLISCGEHNSYGHPGRDMLNRVKDLEQRHEITSKCGQITIDGNGVFFFLQ